MSVDFAVFDPAVAPRNPEKFRAWYDEQTDWDLDTIPEPSILAQPLLRWYEAMTAKFPDLERSVSDDDRSIEYGFTPAFIYCSMPAKHADEAERLSNSLAEKFAIGRYDPMNDDLRHNDCIVFPDGPLPNPPSTFDRIMKFLKGK